MPVIAVEALVKTFSTPVRAPGVKGFFKTLFAPDHREVRAVDGVSLTVEEGETLAFIGPNGAGKSTTIKMLTGLLHPTSGRAEVAGCVPWEERMTLAARIGCVFGQRSQLWYHLPPSDSFELLGAIYDQDRAELKARVAQLTDLFRLGEFLDTPVRKLSLGQRMRCELAACLLHRPRILFLDEPTIGLDVVAKRAIRDFIKAANKDEGTTVFLTSHDAADIEHVCRRVVVVNHGALVLDVPVKELRRQWLRRKVISVRYEHAPERTPEGAGLEVLKRKGAGLKFAVDTSKLEIGRALADIAAAGAVVDITVTDPPLDQVIAAIYEARGGERA